MRRTTPPRAVTAESSLPSTNSLAEYRHQMADLAQVLDQKGLPSLMPVEMERRPDNAFSKSGAVSSPTDTTQSSSPDDQKPPTALASRRRIPTLPASQAAANARPHTLASSSLAVAAHTPTGQATGATGDNDGDIERETDPTRLRHLLLDAREQLRRDRATIDHQQATIRELAIKLNSVSDFMDMQEDVEDRLRGMVQQHEQQLHEHREAARIARLEMLESRVKLRSMEEDLKRTHEADVVAHANELLDAHTAHINEENFELLADRVMLSKDATANKARSAALAEENTKLRRAAELRQSTEKELLVRTTKQKKEIVDLKRQFKVMEDNLERVAADYEAQLATQKKQADKQLKAVTAERDAAQHDALRLHAELSKLRQLSSQMMHQRSELEGFFHAALADVKQEIIAERRQLVVNAAPGISGTQTNASALRIEGQPRLMLTDDAASTSHGRDRRQWTVDKRGFPVLMDPAKVSGKALPPIPTSATQTLNPHAASAPVRGAVVPWEWDGAVDEIGEEGHAPVFHTETTMRPAALSAIPDAPTLRELKSVKMEELSWREKERVLQYLFRRLQRSRPVANRSAPTTVDASEVQASVQPVEEETQEDAPHESDTFLTQ